MREYRNKKSGVVVLVESEIRGEDWEEISDSLPFDSEEKETPKAEEKPKRKTASKKKK